MHNWTYSYWSQALPFTATESGHYRLTFETQTTPATHAATDNIKIGLNEQTGWSNLGGEQNVAITNSGAVGDRVSYTVDFVWSGFGTVGAPVALNVIIDAGAALGYAFMDDFVLEEVTSMVVTDLDPNGVTGVDPFGPLTWNTPQYVPSNYTVYIDSGSGFVANADTDGDLLDASHTPTGLDYGSTYDWFVVSTDPNDGVDYTSETFSFTTRTVSFVVENGVPDGITFDGTSLPLTMSWDAPADLVDLSNPVYVVYIDNIEDADLDDTDLSHTPSFSLEMDTTYTWRVDVVDNSGAGPTYAGPDWTFNTDTGNLLANGDFQTGNSTNWIAAGSWGVVDYEHPGDYFGYIHNGQRSYFAQNLPFTATESGHYRLTFETQTTEAHNDPIDAIQVGISEQSGWSYLGGKQTVILTNPGVAGDRVFHTVDIGWSGSGAIGANTSLDIICETTAVGPPTATGYAYMDNFELTENVDDPYIVAPRGADIAVDTDLTWLAPTGYTVTGYTVYLDPNEAKVIAGDPSVIDVDADIDPLDASHTPTLALGKDVTYYCRVEATDGTWTYSSSVASFTTLPPDPLITADPASVTVADGGTAVFTIAASNVSAYNWYKDGSLTALVDGVQVSGATISGAETDILTITGVTVADEGDYQCIASEAGYDPLPSGTADLVTERLYGHWKFDGDLTDSVQETVAGAPTHDATSIDGSAEFDAATQHVGTGALAFADTGAEVVDVNDFNFFGRGVTVSCWMKRPAADPNGIYYGVITHDGSPSAGRSLWVSHNDPKGYGNLDGPITSTQWGALQSDIASTGDWQYAATTYEVISETEAVWSLYVDGELIVESTVGVETSTDIALLAFGELVPEWTNNCSVDNVKIYTYALDDWAIAQEYVDDDPGSTGPICVEHPAMDIAPVGAPDCEVNLLDFAEFAKGWMESGNVSD
jgi:hypothetical protein